MSGMRDFLSLDPQRLEDESWVKYIEEIINDPSKAEFNAGYSVEVVVAVPLYRLITFHSVALPLIRFCMRHNCKLQCVGERGNDEAKVLRDLLWDKMRSEGISDSVFKYWFQCVFEKVLYYPPT